MEVRIRTTPARATAPPKSWLAVSTTNPCEQTATVCCGQAMPAPPLRNSNPPMMVTATPVTARIAAPHDRSLRESDGENAGAGAAARLGAATAAPEGPPAPANAAAYGWLAGTAR